jgi:hypothetical protein
MNDWFIGAAHVAGAVFVFLYGMGNGSHHRKA